MFISRTLPPFSLFFFHDTATTEIYTLSLHDALPIWTFEKLWRPPGRARREFCSARRRDTWPHWPEWGRQNRSEEHTSELQSRRDLVCRLLLEKKKKQSETKQSHNAKPRSNDVVRPRA